ncbi:MAG: PDZ domain-containing protein [Caldilineaceae bacterium]
MTAGYYRFPTIHNDTIVFVAEDDLWQVPRHGGAAWRLTSNLGEVTYPVLSPDGAWLAFVGREEGASEVYVMPAVGGSARRLTYLSSNCRIVGWTSDGTQIIFCSNYGQIVSSAYGLFTVNAATTNGAITALPYGPAHTIAYGPAGQIVIGRNTQDPARWKRYRGGTTGHLWIDRTGSGEFTRFLDHLQGNIAAPMWFTLPATTTSTNGETAAEPDHLQPMVDGLQDRIFFISDHEGIGNLYSCTPTGTALRRHTDHTDFYVRNPTTDGQHIVYHAGGDLYCYDLATDQDQKVEIRYHSPRVQRNRRFVQAASYLDDVQLHPSGKAMALTTRGKAFAFFNHEGPVLQHGKRDGVRYRLPEWTHNKGNLVLISDEPGEEVIEIYPSDPQLEPRQLADLDIGRAVDVKMSPTHDRMALTNHRNELLLVDLEHATVTVVDRSPYRGIAGFAWSPDGRWLAYGYGATPKTTAIRLYRLTNPEAEDENLRSSAVYTVTQPVLHDIEPAFDPDGKYLYFLSQREFNPVYDGLHFELGFPWGMRPYLVTLQVELPNPFIPQPEWDDDDDDDGDDGAESEEEEGAEEDETADEDGPVADEDEGEESNPNLDMDDEEEDGAWPDEAVRPLRWRSLAANLRQKGVETGEASSEQPPSSQTASAASNGSGKTSAKVQKNTKAEAKAIRIDLDGIERRILAFPVPDGRYGQIDGVANKAIFTVFPVHGALDHGGIEEGDEAELGLLRAYSFKEYRSETLADDVDWFQLSRNRRKLLYAGRNRLRVINAGEKPVTENGPGRRTGWVDLNRIKVSVEPQREWEQMFREAWRLQRDHFWTEDMSEVDWQKVYQRYYPLIERVSSRSEFSDLMWEMQGELGTSHAYEYGGDYRPRPYYSQGFLGASYQWDGEAQGYRVDDLVIGDAWDTQNSSPLAAPGVDINSGDLLVAINGQWLDESTGPAQLLVSQAGQEVLLTFRLQTVDKSAPEEATAEPAIAQSAQPEETEATKADKVEPAQEEPIPLPQISEPSKTDLRSVVVRVIASEAPARYRAWVESNRRYVHNMTGGRVGYVHIPDMGAAGYAEFHRGYLAEVDRDALIIDVRYNGGGHVSQLLLEKLARRRLGYDLSRWGGLSPYPADSVAGPLVAITNEHAGSDGDIFCHSFKLMNLGPLIGKRTWGGVVGISPRHTLVDGTVTTQPEYSFWFKDVGWNVENYGAEPDIEVDITPQDYRQGKDPQLERAVSEIQQLLATAPIPKPDLSTRPSRALPTLPPRL